MKLYLVAALAASFFIPGSTSHAATDQPMKVLICHIPPGNPGNMHEITVDEAAVPDHLAHGDHVGSCVVAPDTRM